MPCMAPAGFDVSCVAHVHSTYSDGTATVPELLSRGPRSGRRRRAAHRPRHARRASRRLGGHARRRVPRSSGPRSAPSTAITWPSASTDEIPARRAHGRRDRGGSTRRWRRRLRRAPVLGGRAHARPVARAPDHPAPRLARARTRPTAADGLELWSLTTDAAEAWHTPAEAWRWLRDPETAVASRPAGASPAPLGCAVGAPARARDRRAGRPRARGPVRRPRSLPALARAHVRPAANPPDLRAAVERRRRPRPRHADPQRSHAGLRMAELPVRRAGGWRPLLGRAAATARP